MATATTFAVVLPHLPTTTIIRCSALPQLPARLFPTTIKQVSGVSRRSSSLFQIKASEDASSPVDANELLDDLKEKWDALENKSTVIVYGESTRCHWFQRCWSWIYRMVCVPISSVQVKQKRVSKRHRVDKEEDCRDGVGRCLWLYKRGDVYSHVPVMQYAFTYLCLISFNFPIKMVYVNLTVH